mgnify:CR=1 FL=1
MAFNFRPKNKKEILSKKKKFSFQAAQIYEYIKKTYGETIVLDPNKDFSDIKIPRDVEDKDNISKVKTKLKKAFQEISGTIPKINLSQEVLSPSQVFIFSILKSALDFHSPTWS